ncbi:hypothetical protein [Bradyrhizobium liaoningense]|uniref:hypothetical protein n=1 Tax=Bradyrhizobium liaoningense TaxID=43992 RepID=UPI001BAE4BBA|nr:hypothetical protein [Bradyrhizobium liaoningense]
MSADLEAPLEVFRYFLREAEAVYVSAPITSGWHFLDWYKNVGARLLGSAEYEKTHAESVVILNRASVADTISAIKQRLPSCVVIDPTAFDFPSWSQFEYRRFWGLVIERFVKRAIFLDGWEASVGCVYEFNVASCAGVPVFDQREAQIGIDEAVPLIEKSIRAMKGLGLDTEVLESAVKDLMILKASSAAGKR